MGPRLVGDMPARYPPNLRDQFRDGTKKPPALGGTGGGWWWWGMMTGYNFA